MPLFVQQYPSLFYSRFPLDLANLILLEGWRKKALCCTPNLEVYTPASCETKLCDIDDTFRCGEDDWSDDFSNEYLCDPEDSCYLDEEETEGDEFRRDLVSPTNVHLEKRGKKRKFEVFFIEYGIQRILEILARRYTGSSHLHDPTKSTPASDNAFR